MSKEDNGGPAFPEARIAGEQGDYWTEHTSGMALRDYFAAKALPALIARQDDCSPLEVAYDAYLFADTMLEARNK